MISFAVEAWALKTTATEAESTHRNAASSVSIARRLPPSSSFGGTRANSIYSAAGCATPSPRRRRGGRVTLWLNLVTPYTPITSDGKEPDLEPFLACIVEAAGKAIRSGAPAPARGAHSVSVQRPCGVSQKDVVFDRVGPRRNAVRLGQPALTAGRRAAGRGSKRPPSSRKKGGGEGVLSHARRGGTPVDAETAVLRARLPARGSRQTESMLIFHSLPRRRCYARHGRAVDEPFFTPGPPPTSSSAYHGSAAMLKPMIDNPIASLRCPPEALPGRPETADTVAAA